MRTKVLFACVIICLSVVSVLAQNKHDRFHLFGSESSYHLTGYCGPFISLSDVEGYLAMNAGVAAGFVVNKKFIVGLYGQKLLTKVPRSDLAIIGYPTFSDGEIKMKHAGGVLGYIYKPDKKVHWGVSGSAGVGRIDLYARGPTNKYKNKIYDDWVFLLIPKLFVEMNMTGWLKMDMSAGFRLVGKVNGTYINQAHEVIPTFLQSDYMKPEFEVALLIGKFRFHSVMLQ